MRIGKMVSLTSFLGCFLFTTVCSETDKKTQIENRFLLLDSRVIDQTENVRLQLGEVTKDPNNPLFEEDFWADPPKPWEARFDNMYPNVIYDKEDELFKIWYKSFVRDAASEATPIEKRPFNRYSAAAEGRKRGILYAFSEDGINWTKPELGLVEFQGRRDNNIVMLNFEGGVLKDKQDDDPARRFKMFGRIDTERQMASAFSEDGMEWSEPVPWPDYNAAGDAHNNAIWAPDLNKYVGITRAWENRVRTVLRTKSTNFVNWSEPVEVLRGENPSAQVYSMPVFYYGNVYLGLHSIIHGQSPHDLVDTELAWSPDTKNWQFISPGEALIPRGGNREHYPDSDYDAGCIFASVPIVKEDEMLLYYGGSNYYHVNWRETSLNLARLRLDGFAGYETDNSASGSVQTSLFTVNGGDFKVNADIKDAGSLRVAVLDEFGEEITGYTLEESQAIIRNATDESITWNGNDLSALNGKKVAFRFEIENAKIYSFSGNLEFLDL